MKLTLKIWRQKSRKDKGQFVSYPIDDVNADMSMLEMSGRAERNADRDAARSRWPSNTTAARASADRAAS